MERPGREAVLREFGGSIGEPREMRVYASSYRLVRADTVPFDTVCKGYDDIAFAPSAVGGCCEVFLGSPVCSCDFTNR